MSSDLDLAHSSSDNDEPFDDRVLVHASGSSSWLDGASQSYSWLDEASESSSAATPGSSTDTTPGSSTDTSDFGTSDCTTSDPDERLYRGTPTRTMLLRQDARRVFKKRLRVEVPNRKKVKQARNGKVKAFEPKPYAKCCNRRCCMYFTDRKDAQIELARRPLYDCHLSRAAMREALQRNAIDLLRNPVDGRAVCAKMALIAYSCSTSFLSPHTKRTQGSQADSNRRRAKVTFSVMAWFEKEKEYTDIMPDTGKFLLPYPRRHAVWQKYMEDHHEITACSTCPLGRDPKAPGPCGCPAARKVYMDVAESYFMHLWRTTFVNCQIRKHMRFSKCVFCVEKRSIKNNRKNAAAVRLEAKDCLSGHYDWVRRERAAETFKVGMRLVSSHLCCCVDLFLCGCVCLLRAHEPCTIATNSAIKASWNRPGT